MPSWSPAASSAGSSSASHSTSACRYGGSSPTTTSSSRKRSPPTVTTRKPPSGCGRTAWTPGGAADVVERLGRGDLLDLPALPDRDHAEEPLVTGLGQGQQVVHQAAVPRLEDLQRQDDAGEQGRPEREQRDQLAHPASVRGASGAPPARWLPWRFAAATPGGGPCSPASTCVDPRCRGPASSPACCPGPAPTSTRSWPPCARCARTCASAAPRRSARSPPGSTAWTPPTSPFRRTRSTGRWPSATRRCGPRWRRRSPGSGRCTPTSGAPTSPPRSCPAAR